MAESKLPLRSSGTTEAHTVRRTLWHGSNGLPAAATADRNAVAHTVADGNAGADAVAAAHAAVHADAVGNGDAVAAAHAPAHAAAVGNGDDVQPHDARARSTTTPRRVTKHDRGHRVHRFGISVCRQ